jgi:hypothetical protein
MHETDNVDRGVKDERESYVSESARHILCDGSPSIQPWNGGSQIAILFAFGRRRCRGEGGKVRLW